MKIDETLLSRAVDETDKNPAGQDVDIDFVEGKVLPAVLHPVARVVSADDPELNRWFRYIVRFSENETIVSDQRSFVLTRPPDPGRGEFALRNALAYQMLSAMGFPALEARLWINCTSSEPRLLVMLEHIDTVAARIGDQTGQSIDVYGPDNRASIEESLLSNEAGKGSLYFDDLQGEMVPDYGVSFSRLATCFQNDFDQVAQYEKGVFGPDQTAVDYASEEGAVYWHNNIFYLSVRPPDQSAGCDSRSPDPAMIHFDFDNSLLVGAVGDWKGYGPRMEECMQLLEGDAKNDAELPTMDAFLDTLDHVCEQADSVRNLLESYRRMINDGALGKSKQDKQIFQKVIDGTSERFELFYSKVC